MAHINTITIAPQESADDLAVTFAAALSNALSWTADGASVWQEKDGLRFYFSVAGSAVDVHVGNALKTTQSGNRVSWAADAYYYLDYYNTENTVTMGIRTTDGAIALCCLIAKNTLGEWKAICAYSNAEFYFDSVVSAPYKWIVSSFISNANVCTSIVKQPDYWGGCMFQDLYMMTSCPYNALDKVFYINGHYYRYVGASGTYGFAIPVG